MREEKKGKWSSDLVLDLYAGLLMEVWEIVSALIGEAILEILFSLSIRKLGQKYPFLGSLRVSEEGLSFDEMRGACRTLSPIDLHRGFQGLITHLFEQFSNLAEGVISRELFPKVFPKVKEAERIISQK